MILIRMIINEEEAKYVVEIHWRIYTSEFQYDRSFIEFFTEPILSFARKLDPGKENIWILEVDRKPKGTISIMKIDEETAQLRWFAIEAEERNKGYGKQLIEQAIQFCRDHHYKRIILWTNPILSAARELYRKAGFDIIQTRERVLLNNSIQEEKWELVNFADNKI